MAVPYIFWLAVRVALSGAARYRVLTYPTGAAGVSGAQIARVWDRLTGSEESDESLSAAASEAVGYTVNVATFTGDFEVRRLQVSFSQSSAAPAGEDVRVITFHLIKVSGASPVATWESADFTAARNAFLTFWTAMRPRYVPGFQLVKTAFYRAGPGIVPPQPPVNTADHTGLPGTSAAGASLPPQVALTVMERFAGVRKNHGRWYLPNPAADQTSLVGRPTADFINHVADSADTMYEAWRTANLPAVVYLPALGERSPTASDPRLRTKGTFAARPAAARTVDEIVVDDIWDVIRSRRYDRAVNRQARVIGT